MRKTLILITLIGLLAFIGIKAYSTEIIDGEEATIGNLTTVEINQLEAIGTTTISSAQWTGLGGASTYGISLWSVADEAALKLLVNLEIGTDVEAKVTEGSLPDSTVLSEDFKDGELVNVDVSATAAIAGSKIREWAALVTRDADATPEVADGGLYALTNTGALTVTDFVDSDGDHSEFVTGVTRILIKLEDADITIQFDTNANIEGNAGVDFTASASQITYIEFLYEDARWNSQGFDMGMNTPTTLAISTIQAAMKVYTYASAQTLTASQMNSIVIMTGAGDVNIPADQCDTATGKWITIKSSAAHLNSLTSNDGTDAFVLSDGTDCGNADELDLAGAAGNQVTCVCLQANKWWVTGEIGSCVDGGAAD